MNEEHVSRALYECALEDPKLEVLSWQGIDGKGYFAADIKLRLPSGRRLEPDIVLLTTSELWAIEVKDRHSKALADEAKLLEMVDVLGPDGVLRQIAIRSGTDVSDRELVPAVAFATDDLGTTASCEGIVHVDWSREEAAVLSDSLSRRLRALRSQARRAARRAGS